MVKLIETKKTFNKPISHQWWLEGASTDATTPYSHNEYTFDNNPSTPEHTLARESLLDNLGLIRLRSILGAAREI